MAFDCRLLAVSIAKGPTLQNVAFCLTPVCRKVGTCICEEGRLGAVDSRAERECVSAFLVPGAHYNEELCPGTVKEAGILDLVPC